jgi:hypothetical protein
MSKLLQIGHSSRAELHAARYGHIACTLGGVNYESRGGKGCLRGSSARGATHRLFKHHYFLVLTDAQAKAAKKYADGCVGQPYRITQVPTAHHGGDCSGYVSGIICAAKGKRIRRLFTTASWPRRFDDADLGFKKGLGGGVVPGHPLSAIGVVDRPYPGHIIKKSTSRSNHVKWIQARLNFAAQNHHPVLGGARLRVDGFFGRKTFDVVEEFQRRRHLEVDGKVGRDTWTALLKVR